MLSLLNPSYASAVIPPQMEINVEPVTVSAPQMQEAYLDHLLTHGTRPVSVYAFAKSQGISETQFYDLYNNFDALEQHIWLDVFDRTHARLKADATYGGYSVREKLLAFYFTWVDELKPLRSFVIYANGQTRRWAISATHASLGLLKIRFRDYAHDLVNEGLDRGELISRPLLTDRYADGLWAQLLFVTRFWADDTSPAFEQTDAAIEKAVRLSF